MKKEGHLEVPSWQVHLRKPEFLLLSCIAESWVSSFSKEGRVAPVSKALVESTFCPNGNFKRLSYYTLKPFTPSLRRRNDSTPVSNVWEGALK